MCRRVLPFLMLALLFTWTFGPPCSATEAPSIEPQIRKLADRDATIESRVKVARKLATLGPGAHDAIGTLLATFSESNRHLRAAAAEALAQIGPEIVPPLLERLRNSDSEVREYAAYALLRAADKGNAPGSGKALIAALQDDDSTVRIHAIHALWWATERDDPQAIRATRKALHDSNYAVRHAAALELGWRGDQESVPALILLLRDAAPRVQGAAREALQTIGTPEALAALEETATP